MSHVWRMIERVLGTVAVLALFSLVVLPATQVFMRDAFNAPIIGLEEGTRWGLIITVFFGAPLLIATNEQIRLAEFIDQLPRRVRIGLERVILLCFRRVGGLHRLCRPAVDHAQHGYPHLRARHPVLALRFADVDRLRGRGARLSFTTRCAAPIRRSTPAPAFSEDRSRDGTRRRGSGRVFRAVRRRLSGGVRDPDSLARLYLVGRTFRSRPSGSACSTRSIPFRLSPCRSSSSSAI